MLLPSEIAANDAAADARRPQHPAGGRFIITLCEEAAPVTIPKAHLAHLNAFRFFGSGVRGDGPPYCVHMGYFPTRTDAEKWLQVLLPLYPKARIGELPPERPRNLTDTGVMRILEQRRTSDRRTGKEESGIRKIPLLAPEETATRRTLRDAVIRGLPVSFAVQLQLSETPIDLRTTAWDPIFRFYSVYATTVRHEGREWSCLRLGFFSDAISAKQVALYLRSSYEGAAVVPVGANEKEAAERVRR